MRRAILLGLLTASAPASAQTIIQYDDIVQDVQAAITCGFCATEKFGTIFYEVGQGDGLPANAFPLTLNAIQVAVASTQVTGDLFMGIPYQCEGTTQGGRVDATLEVYAGVSVPAQITTLPASGAWPGETVVVPPGSVQIEKSVATSQGAMNFNVMINDLTVGATVPAPNTYLRVVITIPSGGVSAACTDLGLQPPALSPFRDNNGRIGPKRGFIYQLGLPSPFNTAPKWTWMEDVSDPLTGQSGINGDWLIRLDIRPNGTIPSGDAGVSVDGGAPAPDASADAGVEDLGVQPSADAGPADTGDTEPVDGGSDPAIAPSISNISPDSTVEGTPASVTIVGAGFQEGLSVRLGGILTEVKLLSGSTTVIVEVPIGVAAGVYDVVLTNPDGQSAILSDGFEVTRAGGAAPTRVIPSSSCVCARAERGPLPGGLLVMLSGMGLLLHRRRRE